MEAVHRFSCRETECLLLLGVVFFVQVDAKRGGKQHSLRCGLLLEPCLKMVADLVEELLLVDGASL